MSIGRSFEEVIQKGLRMIGQGMHGFVGNEHTHFDNLDEELANPTDLRIFSIASALEEGYSIERISELTKIDPWFLGKLKNIVDYKNVLSGYNSLDELPDEVLRKAKELGFFGMHFVTDDITNTPKDVAPDMVISLHACDIATDIVLDTAAKLGEKVILSTPCCHRELSTKIDAPVLSFVTKYPKLKRSLCDSLTDALRLERLSYLGYDVNATELVDPEDTPKNTLIRAVKRRAASTETSGYTELLRFLLGEGADDYIGKL
jgi:hypothetical protein